MLKRDNVKPNRTKLKEKEEVKDCKLTHFEQCAKHFHFISFNKLVDAWNLIYWFFVTFECERVCSLSVPNSFILERDDDETPKRVLIWFHKHLNNFNVCSLYIILCSFLADYDHYLARCFFVVVIVVVVEKWFHLFWQSFSEEFSIK